MRLKIQCDFEPLKIISHETSLIINLQHVGLSADDGIGCHEFLIGTLYIILFYTFFFIKHDIWHETLNRNKIIWTRF